MKANQLLLRERQLLILPMFAIVTNSYAIKVTAMTYEVQKLTQPIAIDGNWEKDVWKNVPALDIKNYMGEKPDHLPRTQAKLLYDDSHIYVIFRVEDRYVRVVAEGYHGKVWEDSCVEFFLTPGDDISQGCFNVEINAGGTMLFNHQATRGQNVRRISTAHCDQIKIAHSLPEIIEQELAEPTIWTLEYRIPFHVLEKYAPVAGPAPGVIWRANFYKCADQTSHPHWLTWSVVDKPEPDFHRPEFFGQLKFK